MNRIIIALIPICIFFEMNAMRRGIKKFNQLTYFYREDFYQVDSTTYVWLASYIIRAKDNKYIFLGGSTKLNNCIYRDKISKVFPTKKYIEELGCQFEFDDQKDFNLERNALAGFKILEGNFISIISPSIYRDRNNKSIFSIMYKISGNGFVYSKVTSQLGYPRCYIPEYKEFKYRLKSNKRKFVIFTEIEKIEMIKESESIKLGVVKLNMDTLRVIAIH